MNLVDNTKKLSIKKRRNFQMKEFENNNITASGKNSKNVTENEISTKDISGEYILFDFLGLNCNHADQNKNQTDKELLEHLVSLFNLNFDVTRNRGKSVSVWLFQNKTSHFPPFVKTFLQGYIHLDGGVFFELIKSLNNILLNGCKKYKKSMEEITKEELKDTSLYLDVPRNNGILRYLSKFYKTVNPFPGIPLNEILLVEKKPQPFSHPMVHRCERELKRKGWMEKSVFNSFTFPVKRFLSWLCTNYNEFENFTINNIPIWDINVSHLEDYKSYLIGSVIRGEFANITASKHLKNIKHFFSLTCHLGFRLTDMDRVTNIVADEYKYREIPSNEELQNFFDIVIQYSDNLEEELLTYQFMLFLGLRVNEVFNLKYDDLDLENKIMILKGKGGKYSRLPLPQIIIESVSLLPRQKKGQLLFSTPPNSGINKFKKRHMLYCLISGIKLEGVHIFRHSFISRLSKITGCTPGDLMLLGRHNDLKTTSKYLHRNNDELKDSVNKINFLRS